jgi:hypothetical protein
MAGQIVTVGFSAVVGTNIQAGVTKATRRPSPAMKAALVVAAPVIRTETEGFMDAAMGGKRFTLGHASSFG